MHSIDHTELFEQSPVLKQPLLSDLTCLIQALSSITHRQFVAAIGVSYAMVSRWETGRNQPSELALRQIQALTRRCSQFTFRPVQDSGKELLALSFAKMQG